MSASFRVRLVVLALILGGIGAALWSVSGSGAEEHDALVLQGTRAYRQRRYDLARDALARAAALDERDAASRALIARCFIEQRGLPEPGRTVAEEDALVAEALRWAEAALAIDPEQVLALKTVHAATGFPELRAYDPQRALDAAERVLAADPGETRFALRFLREMFGNLRFPRATADDLAYESDIGLDIAITHAERLHDLAAEGSVAREEFASILALAYAGMGEFESALRVWRPLVDSADPPTASRATIECGYACFRLGRTDEAVGWLKRSIDLDRGNRDTAAWLLRRALLDAGRAPDEVPERYRFPFAGDDAEVGDWRFTDVAPELGVDKTDGAGPSVFADLDGDERPDIVAAGCDTFTRLYLQRDGRFEDATLAAGLHELEAGFATIAVDEDDDGDLDLFVSRYGWSGPGPNTLLRHRPDGTFEDVTAATGLGDRGSGFGANWADLDGDGDLDLFLVNGILGDGSTNRLYLREADGTYRDATEAAGLAERPGTRTLGCALSDYDKDGDVDVFVNGFDPWPSRLYRNRGDGTFDEVAAEVGVTHPLHPGYVAFFADFDGDAWPDLLATCLADWQSVLDGLAGRYEPPDPARPDAETLKLFRNRGDGTFARVSATGRTFRPTGTMGATVADFDNDGDLDLYLGTGDPELKRLEPNVLYRNDGGFRFADVTEGLGVGHVGKGHGMTVADYDADGDLDLYAPQGGFFHADLTPNALYRNDGGNANRSLRVRLAGTASNRRALGARVTLTTDRGVQYREPFAALGFGSTSEQVLHFGLGRDGRALRLDVVWPSGAREAIDLADAPPVIVVTEGEGRWRAAGR